MAVAPRYQCNVWILRRHKSRHLEVVDESGHVGVRDRTVVNTSLCACHLDVAHTHTCPTANSTPAFSIPALSCRIFRSRIFSAPFKDKKIKKTVHSLIRILMYSYRTLTGADSSWLDPVGQKMIDPNLVTLLRYLSAAAIAAITLTSATLW